MRLVHQAHRLTYPVHFSGRAATRAAGQTLMHGFQFEQTLQADRSPYVGRLPKALVQSGVTLPMLDQLNRALEKADYPEMTVDDPLPGIPGSRISYAGHGAYGTVYALTIGKNTYAFKAYYEKTEFDNKPVYRLYHGTFAETARGLFFNHLRLGDVPTLYCANPRQRWALSRFISETSRQPKTGRFLLPTLKQLGLLMCDYVKGSDTNRLFRFFFIDRGGIVPGKAPLTQILRDLNDPKRRNDAAYSILRLRKRDQKKAFLAAMAIPELRPMLASLITNLKLDVPWAMQAAMRYPECRSLALGQGRLEKHYSPEGYLQLVDEALSDPHCRAAAAEKLMSIQCEQPALQALFEKAFLYPESRPIACKYLWRLPPTNRLERAEALMEQYPDSRPALADYLITHPAEPEKQWQTIQKALQYPESRSMVAERAGAVETANRLKLLRQIADSYPELLNMAAERMIWQMEKDGEESNTALAIIANHPACLRYRMQHGEPQLFRSLFEQAAQVDSPDPGQPIKQ